MSHAGAADFGPLVQKSSHRTAPLAVGFFGDVR